MAATSVAVAYNLKLAGRGELYLVAEPGCSPFVVLRTGGALQGPRAVMGTTATPSVRS